MSHVITGFPATSDGGSALPATHSAQRVRTTPVFVTEQEIALSTAAALAVPSATTRRGWLTATLAAATRRILIPLFQRRPHFPSSEPYYLAMARMSREMEHL
jgi:hypothetical protein